MASEFGRYFNKEENKHLKKCFRKDFPNYKNVWRIKNILHIHHSIDFIDVFLYRYILTWIVSTYDIYYVINDSVELR